MVKELENVTPDELLRAKIDHYRKLIIGKKLLFPGIEELLKTLKRNYPLALISSAKCEVVMSGLKQEWIEQFFKVIITGDDVKKGKPDPEPYRKGIQILGISPQRGIAVEDTPTGIKSAKAAGLKCIAVTNTRPKNELLEADLVIEDITKLSKQAIDELFADENDSESLYNQIKKSPTTNKS